MANLDSFYSTWTPRALSLLRIIAAFLFMAHGAQKLFGALGGEAVPLVSQMGLAGAIELVGGLLIAIGLFAGLAAFIASGEMAFAYFMAHAPRGFYPIANSGELAALYCFVFFYIIFAGPGPWSLDAAMRKQ